MGEYSALSPSFFARDTVLVARELLGSRLVLRPSGTEQALVCTIVETEAYTGYDPACHAYGRRTGRSVILYDEPGLAYVYLIYGMYHCLNVVTEPKGNAGAVLFRALEPPEGTAYRTNGPGRLTKALNITREQHNALDLTDAGSPLFLAEGKPVADAAVVQTTRIGITKAADYPWRFYLHDNPWVSVLERTTRKKPRS